jgi:hypothetical protein
MAYPPVTDSTTIYPEIMPFGLREIASMIVCSRGPIASLARSRCRRFGIRRRNGNAPYPRPGVMDSA